MRTPVSRRPSGMLALGAAMACAIWTAAGQEERLPIIARMQVLYSVVGHHCHITDRVSFYNNSGNPRGNVNFVVPHLVSEPSVTLYNPYNTELQLTQSRVRLENPPVGFKFKKNSDYLRTEWASGDTFYGLGRFQVAGQFNSNVQKTLTLSLGGGNKTNYLGVITLQPGESKTFSIRVESNWTWGLETGTGYTPRSFYDWDSSRNFTNKDGRTQNDFGTEAIAPYLDYRAGFQADHLSVSPGRPVATRYGWEGVYGTYGWVAIKTTDTFTTEAKGLRTAGGNLAIPDFKLSLLRGLTVDPAADTAKSYSFDVADLIQAGVDEVGVPTITRTHFAGDLIQTPNDSTPGGKTTIAVFTVVAKSTAIQQGAFLGESQAPTNQLYEARVDSIDGFIDPTLDVGPSDGPTSGISMIGTERVGDFFMLDVAAPPSSGSSFQIKGTSDLGLGFPDDITTSCVITEGPSKSGVFKVTVPLAGLGDHYFVRIER
jgi:hypothetical protein